MISPSGLHRDKPVGSPIQERFLYRNLAIRVLLTSLLSFRAVG